MDQRGQIIFVTGASRSGTTMLSRILGNHSHIRGLRELHFFGDLCQVSRVCEPLSEESAIGLAALIFARQARSIWRGKPDDADRARAARLVKDLPGTARRPKGVFVAVLQDLAAEHGKLHVCEQTPRNIFYARELLRELPQAKVVHMMRDPRAVLASQKNRWKQRSMGRGNIPVSETLRTLFNYHPITISKLWTRASQRALALENHDRFLLLRFEDVVGSPREQVSRLAEFIGLEFEEQMLDVPKMGSSHRQNLEAKGIAKDVVDRWAEVLTLGELRVCEHYAKVLMNRYGYSLRSEGGLSLSLLNQILRYPLHALAVLLLNPKRAWIQLGAVFGSQTAEKTCRENCYR